MKLCQSICHIGVQTGSPGQMILNLCMKYKDHVFYWIFVKFVEGSKHLDVIVKCGYGSCLVKAKNI